MSSQMRVSLINPLSAATITAQQPKNTLILKRERETPTQSQHKHENKHVCKEKKDEMEDKHRILSYNYYYYYLQTDIVAILDRNRL